MGFLLSDVSGDVAVWIGTGAAAVFIAQNGLNLLLIRNLISMAASRNRESQLLIEKSLLMEQNKETAAELARREARIASLLTENDRLRVERDEMRRANEAARHGN